LGLGLGLGPTPTPTPTPFNKIEKLINNLKNNRINNFRWIK